ncbi:MAG TPA: sulfite exporter TauE/SafE family protein [Steroidobacteraceae bacterium]|nr:sulfite exporter TauE/SafE family protein [Steroidobacteraceae bacterium]
MNATSIAAANLAVMLGAILQASTGLGSGLIIVPLLALVSLVFVPGPLVLASMALSGLMAYQGRREIDGRGLPMLLGFLFVGVALGALSIAAIPVQRAGIAFGVLVLVAVAVSAAIPRLRRTVPVAAGAGVLSGFMGAISGIGAPILALIYQHEEPRVLRATLGFIFFLSSIAILVCLHFAGRFGWQETWLGLWLVPGYVIGFLVAPPIARLLDRGNSRSAVLVISSLSAIVLIVRSIS